MSHQPVPSGYVFLTRPTDAPRTWGLASANAFSPKKIRLKTKRLRVLTTPSLLFLWRLVVPLFLFLASSSIGIATEGFQIGAALPDSIVKSWQLRHDACSSVYWKIKSRDLITKGMLNDGPDDLARFGPRPKEDEWRESIFETWIDFPTLRVRNIVDGYCHHLNDDGTTPLIPRRKIELFDGLQSQSRLNEQIINVYTPDSINQGVFDSHQVPLFWGVGMFQFSDPSKLNTKTSPKDFRIHDIQGTGDSLLLYLRQNRSTSTPDNFTTFVVDVAKDFAIVGRSLTSNGKLYAELRADWSKSGSEWIPLAWKETRFRPDGNISIYSESEVVERRCNPELRSIEFKMELKPGDKYFDKKTETEFVKASAGKPDIPLKLYEIQKSRDFASFRWLSSSAFVFLCLAGATAWYRRFHAGK